MRMESYQIPERMKNRKTTSRVFGLLLVIIGSIWMLRELGYAYLLNNGAWMWVLLIFGAFVFINGYIQNRRIAVFWGMMMLLIGAVNLMQEFRIIHPYLTDIWPLYLVIVGASFYATVPVTPNDYASLIPGTIFVLSGTFLFLEINEYMPYGIFYGGNRLLAILLILIGALLLWGKSGFRRSKIEKDIAKKDEKAPTGKANI